MMLIPPLEKDALGRPSRRRFERPFDDGVLV
jgi:hypothetical protein